MSHEPDFIFFPIGSVIIFLLLTGVGCAMLATLSLNTSEQATQRRWAYPWAHMRLPHRRRAHSVQVQEYRSILVDQACSGVQIEPLGGVYTPSWSRGQPVGGSDIHNMMMSKVTPDSFFKKT